MKQKMWQCKICRCTQEYSRDDVICHHCGMNLIMGAGEVIFVDSSNPNSPSNSPSKSAPVVKAKKKPVFLWILIPVLVLALAAAGLLIWKPWNRVSGTVALDLQFFAGEQAQLEKASSFLEREKRVYQMTSGDVAKKVLEEYRQLLEEEYSFEQVQTHSVSEDDLREEYYCYRYANKSELQAYTLSVNNTVTLQDQHLTLVLQQEDGQCNIVLSYAKELNFQFHKTRSSGAGQGASEKVASIPELQSFVNLYGHWVQFDNENEYLQNSWKFTTQKTAETIFEEYCRLLDEKYPFDPVQEYHTTCENGCCDDRGYCYQYTGDAAVDAIEYEIEDGKMAQNTHCVVELHEKEDIWYIRLKYSDDIYPELKNVRTGYDHACTTTIPKLETFVGSYGQFQQITMLDENYQIYVKEMTKEAALAIRNEYGEILARDYGFSLKDTVETTWGDGLDKNAQYYVYNGTADIFGFKSHEMPENHHVRLIVWEMENGTYALQLYTRNTIQQEDKGLQTTYQAND